MSYNRYKQKYTCFGHFLNANHLSLESSVEIRTYYDFVCAKRAERGWFRSKKHPGLEKHHIVPRAFEGKNQPSNYVNLTAAEHLYAHRLLYFALKSSKKFDQRLRHNARNMCPKMRKIVKEMLMPSNVKKVLLLEYKNQVTKNLKNCYNKLVNKLRRQYV